MRTSPSGLNMSARLSYNLAEMERKEVAVARDVCNSRCDGHLVFPMPDMVADGVERLDEHLAAIRVRTLVDVERRKRPLIFHQFAS